MTQRPGQGKRGYNRLAPFYDTISGFVFGKSITRAHQTWTEAIPANAKILILGGGTGKAAAALKAAGKGSAIWYVDISQEMIRKARKRVARQEGSEEIKWHWMVQDAVHSQLPEGPFDAILIHFFLDLFDETNLPVFLQKLKPHLHPDGKLWVSDFQRPPKGISRVYASLLIPVMYAFFGICAGLRPSKLPNFHQILLESGFRIHSIKTYYAGIIFSGMWEIDTGKQE